MAHAFDYWEILMIFAVARVPAPSVKSTSVDGAIGNLCKPDE
jgi:hypothetical protein